MIYKVKTEKITIRKKDLSKLRKYFLIWYDKKEGYYLGREKTKNLFERLFNL